MVLAAVSTPLIVLACAAAIVALAPLKIVAAFAIAAAIGIGGTITERRNRPPAKPVSPAQAPELHAIVDRLCVLADVPKPEIVIEAEASGRDDGMKIDLDPDDPSDSTVVIETKPSD